MLVVAPNRTTSNDDSYASTEIASRGPFTRPGSGTHVTVGALKVHGTVENVVGKVPANECLKLALSATRKPVGLEVKVNPNEFV